MAANPDPPPVIPVPESITAQAAYQLRYEIGHGACDQFFTREIPVVCVEFLFSKVPEKWLSTKKSFATAIHTQTSYRHGVNC